MATSAHAKDLMTPDEALAHYGDPEKENNMIVYRPTQAILQTNSVIPGKIYCNKDLVIPLADAFNCALAKGILNEIKTWDGCFNIRPQKGTLARQSLHSWGLAIDINAAWNQFGKRPTLSEELVRCFTGNGFHWGGYWKRPDGMHFQLAQLPQTQQATAKPPASKVEMLVDMPTLKPPYPRSVATQLLASELFVEQPIEIALLEKVKAFQRKSKLVADGIVGPKTWRALVGG